MLCLDKHDPRPVYEQVVEGLERLMARGVLVEDDQLPSVRQLAMDLSVNPNTIQKAYSELLSRGEIYSIRGRGNFVSGEADVRGRMMQNIRSRMETLLREAKEIGATKQECEQMFCSLLGGLDYD
ncbi:MAG: GntR family transcriptional regulator [Eubacteriales bacterium]|nr:GntR family transcriptional regulator [Eubacteriales bacterium]